MTRFISLVVFFTVIFCLSPGLRPQPPSGTDTYVPYPDWLEGLRWKYKLYRWPELRQLEQDSSLNALVTVSKEMDSTFGSAATITVYQVVTFHSPYLKSRYHLAYIQSNLSMLGVFTPQTFFFTVAPGSDKFAPLGGHNVTVGDMVITSGFVRPDWSAEIRDVANDCRVEAIRDSTEALAAAMDMVSVACGHQPVVFINSIYDVYEFSNSVAGDLLWDETATADTIPRLLSAFQVRGVRDNKYLTGNYVSITYDSVLFKPYERLVEPPVVVSGQVGRFEVSLFTWSPCNGSLIAWDVVIDRRTGVFIDYFLVAEDVGFRFTGM
jgi:hypothetical protein